MQSEPVQFSVGSVLSATFSTFFGRFVHFIPLALLCYVPVFILLVFTDGADSSGGSAFFENTLDTLCASIFTSIATYEVVMNASGRHVTLGQTINAVVPRLWVVFLASLLYSLCIGLGLVLLIIPGLYIMTILFVIIPAIVVEGLGVGAGFSRSAELTRGYRWPIFGMVLILVAGTIGFAIGAVLAIESIFPGSTDDASVLIGMTVVGVIIGVFSAIATAHTFVRLRIAKEGSTVQELADVFS